MALECIAPPLVEPVTLTDLKQFCRLDPGDTSQDDTLTLLNQEARGHAELYTQRCFVQQTWRLFMDFFPGYIDTKLAGSKVSSPFVSGSNAILVGIRYGIVLPYPPVQAILAFTYQNANGLVTSMIIGPLTIAAVTNVIGQPVSVALTQPHGLPSNATVTIAGNAALVAAVGGQASQVIVVTGDYSFAFLGSQGSGSAIDPTGTVMGYNFIQDTDSNPARLVPIFGQMWPVARVVPNAIVVDYRVGLANPVEVSTTVNDAAIASPYQFQSSDIGREITIPGATAAGGTLSTIVLSVSAGIATLRDAPQTAVANVTALLINTPSGKPNFWSKVRRAIMTRVLESHILRLPRREVEDTFQRILRPMRDLRI